MPLRLIDTPSVVDVGDTWRAWFLVTDYDGVNKTADTVEGTVTEPDDATGSLTIEEQDTTGLYLATYDTTQTGDILIELTVTDSDFDDDVAAFRVTVNDLSGTLPDLTAVKAYLGSTTSATDAQITDALNAEIAAQARMCNIPAAYPDDLAQALKRRVARNLAARAVPVASFTAFEGGGTTQRVPQRDPEIARLEAPWRKWVVA